MQEYISKQQQVLRPAEQIYAVISRFDNLTPALADKVEEWQATEDSCSFKAKGFTVKLRMEEREPGKYVKVVGDDGGVPMDFAFWIQLQEVSAADTRLRLVLRIDLNMMMKMMIGSKLQGALDQIAEGIARAMNAAPQVWTDGKQSPAQPLQIGHGSADTMPRGDDSGRRRDVCGTGLGTRSQRRYDAVPQAQAGITQAFVNTTHTRKT